MTTLPSPTPAVRGAGGTAPILSVEELFVEFRTSESVVNAVNGVSYTVSQGETLAILGESGSGKSVSAQAIMGILDTPPAQIPHGEIWF
jgi:oligopeptide transport system ATP-binding protein